MNNIPKKIHQIWYQGEEHIPEKYRSYQASWKEHNPDWSYTLWDSTSMRQLIKNNYNDFLPYYDGYPLDIQRIDACRYFILNTFGGFYLDMDMQCLKSIDDLSNGHQLVLSKTVGYCNCVFASISGHSFWQHVFKQLVVKSDILEQSPVPASKGKIVTKKKSISPMQVAYSTGPRFFTECISETSADVIAGTLVCPGRYFEAGAPVEIDGYRYMETNYNDAYALHDGDGNWVPWLNRMYRPITKAIFSIYWWLKPQFKS
jgi:mannosyltransferase OCH1-like enzyme